eukprot:4756469-Amphidinium_carterae.1
MSVWQRFSAEATLCCCCIKANRSLTSSSSCCRSCASFTAQRKRLTLPTLAAKMVGKIKPQNHGNTNVR